MQLSVRSWVARSWVARSWALVSLLTLLACRSNTEPQGQGASGGDEQPRRADRQEEQIAAPVRDDGTIFADAEMMGTRVSINLWIGGGDAVKATKAINDAMFEMARIESIASEWRADTDLSRLNAHAGEGPQKVAPELVEILARAREVSADTGGLFDVSFYGVGQLWRFEPGAEPPSAEAIAERLPLVDWTKIEVDEQAHTAALAKAGMKVGLGAIAKGYAVDKAAALLRERGFANFIVEGGGDTYVSGRKGDKDWRVGVQDPKQTVGRVGYLVAEDQAVVTSGNYARFFVWDGVHYTHILDPRSGWPIETQHSPKSVTLVAKDATTADAYCTAVSVMKPEQGLAFVEARPALEAIIIGPDDQLLISSGLKSRFVDEREPSPPQNPEEPPQP